MVLSGGPGGAVEMLQPIADHLKDRYRCIMLEQRGTGRSKLERYDDQTISFDAYIGDIDAVREQLHQEKMIVVGNSWGMTLGIAYTAAHPDRVSALATLGSGSLTGESEAAWNRNMQARLTNEQKRKVRELGSRGLTPDEGYIEWFKIVMPAYFYKPEVAARFATTVKVGDLNGRIPGPAAHMMERLEEYTLDRLDRISCPMLCVQGRQDLAPPETAKTIGERVKGATVVFLDECGHVPWLDQPEKTRSALDKFLSSLASEQ